MKRIAGILLVSVYMFSFAEFHNLLKIPVLFAHYQEHQQQNEISFWSFIKLHYEGPIVFDEDYQRDRQLPFQDADCCPISSTNLFECHQAQIVLATPPPVMRKFCQYQEVNISLINAYEFFQPPRFA